MACMSKYPPISIITDDDDGKEAIMEDDCLFMRLPTEMIVEILKNVTNGDLLWCRRVCRMFKQCVDYINPYMKTICFDWEFATDSISRLNYALDSSTGRRLKGPSSSKAILAACAYGDAKILEILIQRGYVFDYEHSIRTCIMADNSRNLSFIIDNARRGMTLGGLKYPEIYTGFGDSSMRPLSRAMNEFHACRGGRYLRTAIENNSFKCFALLFEKGMGSDQDANLFEYIITRSCGSACVKMFKYLLEKGYPLPTTKISWIAARAGNLDIIRYLFEIGQKCEAYEARGGIRHDPRSHFEFHQMFTSETIKVAVAGGDILCIGYLFEIECPVEDPIYLFRLAMEGGDMKVFEYLHKKIRLKLRCRVLSFAISMKNWDAIFYCLDNGISVKQDVKRLLFNSAMRGDMNIFERLHKDIGLKLDSHVLCDAILLSKWSAVYYCLENGVPLDQDVKRFASEHGKWSRSLERKYIQMNHLSNADEDIIIVDMFNDDETDDNTM